MIRHHGFWTRPWLPVGAFGERIAEVGDPVVCRPRVAHHILLVFCSPRRARGRCPGRPSGHRISAWEHAPMNRSAPISRLTGRRSSTVLPRFRACRSSRLRWRHAAVAEGTRFQGLVEAERAESPKHKQPSRRRRADGWALAAGRSPDHVPRSGHAPARFVRQPRSAGYR